MVILKNVCSYKQKCLSVTNITVVKFDLIPYTLFLDKPNEYGNCLTLPLVAWHGNITSLI